MRLLSLTLAALLLSGCAGLKTDLLSTQKQADLAYAQGDFANAAQNYSTLAKALPTDAGVRYQLANSLARQGKTDEAIVAYRETLVRDPQHARAWHNLLQVQIRDAKQTAEELLRTLNHQQPHAEQARTRAEQLLKLNAPTPATDALATQPATDASSATAELEQEP